MKENIFKCWSSSWNLAVDLYLLRFFSLNMMETWQSMYTAVFMTPLSYTVVSGFTEGTTDIISKPDRSICTARIKLFYSYAHKIHMYTDRSCFSS